MAAMKNPDVSRWVDMGREVIATEMEGLAAVRESLGGGFADAVELLAGCRGRVIVTGIGKSGLVGRKIAATFSSTGTPAAFLHPVEGAHGDLGMVRADDVVLAISNSGETHELNAILPSLAAVGASIIALTSDPASTLGRMAQVVIPVKVPREACLLNLAPTASTTAALAVGDALAACMAESKEFGEADFRRTHPGGALGQRLSMRVEELMQTRDLPVAAATSSLGEALAVLDGGRLGMVVLVDDAGHLRGVLTDGDVRRLAVGGGLDIARAVAEVMSREPKVLNPGQTAAEAMDLMESRLITVLPIVDGERRLLGLVHLHDLLGRGRVQFAGR